MPARRKNWFAMILAWLRTGRIHPLDLIEPNVSVAGIHLLHLQARESLLRPALEQIFQAIVAGELTPVLDRVFPLDRTGAIEVHQYLHDRRVTGKVVLVSGLEGSPMHLGYESKTPNTCLRTDGRPKAPFDKSRPRPDVDRWTARPLSSPEAPATEVPSVTRLKSMTEAPAE